MLAILQMSDTPQIESTAQMLRYAGYNEIKVCGSKLRNALKDVGCDTVLPVSSMIALGYDDLEVGIDEATPDDMRRCDLFVEIKIRNVKKILNKWPRLEHRIAWWRVNGAQPEICPTGGDEVNLICPIITACLWYGTDRYYRESPSDPSHAQGQSNLEHIEGREIAFEELKAFSDSAKTGSNGMAYTFWPPYPRQDEYLQIDRRGLDKFHPPFCVCHNVYAWGFNEAIDPCVEMGVRFFGNGSPSGQIPHSCIPAVASDALALVHMKSVDCPGWALYEALLAGCPVITSRQLNSRMLAYNLLIDNETCLEFGIPCSLEYGRGDTAIDRCVEDIEEALSILADPSINYNIGQAGRNKLIELMWTEERDGQDFSNFCKNWFVQ